MDGVVFDIQKFSTHDGDGIRTTVFLKGCDNRCLWCHNPESLSARPQLQFIQNRCIGCGACVKACPHGVFDADGTEHPERCRVCGACVKACCTKARQIVGKTMTADEVLEAVLRDKAFYDNSGGGVTFSGGEPMLQIDFLAELVQRCKQAGVHVCIQTACNVPFARFERVLPYTDLLMCDFKIFDDALHREYVGVSNARIVENLRRFSERPVRLVVRTPVIGGVNDTPRQIEPICAMIRGFANLDYYELLRYHAYGLGKLQALRMQFGKEFDTPSDETMHRLYQTAQKYIPRVKCGGERTW